MCAPFSRFPPPPVRYALTYDGEETRASCGSAFAPAAFRVALPSLSVPRMNSEHRSASFGLSPWAYFPRLSFRFRRDVLYSRRLMGFICHQCSRAYLIAVEVLCLSHAFRVLLQCLSASRCPLRRSCPCAGPSATGCGIHPIAPSHFGPSLILSLMLCLPFWRGSPCRGQLVFPLPSAGRIIPLSLPSPTVSPIGFRLSSQSLWCPRSLFYLLIRIFP